MPDNKIDNKTSGENQIRRTILIHEFEPGIDNINNGSAKDHLPDDAQNEIKVPDTINHISDNHISQSGRKPDVDEGYPHKFKGE